MLMNEKKGGVGTAQAPPRISPNTHCGRLGLLASCPSSSVKMGFSVPWGQKPLSQVSCRVSEAPEARPLGLLLCHDDSFVK